MKHETTIEYCDGNLKHLAVDIANLQYDALQDFLLSLAEKLEKDAEADRTRNRPILSSRLEAAARNIEDAARAIALAWKICKPHVENQDGKRCSGRPDEDVRACGNCGTVHAASASDGTN
jgi:hypothetical protein